jgi:hypothetical protein
MASAIQRMGQVARKAASEFTGGGGGGIDPSVFEQFWPKKGVGTKIRIIPGEFKNPEDGVVDPWYTYVEHNQRIGGNGPNGRTLRAACTSRLRKKTGDDCVVCAAAGKLEGIKRSVRRAFTVIVLRNYHKEMIPGRKDPSKSYERMSICEGSRTCKLCKDNVDKIFGARRWWGVGLNHFTQLSGLNVSLGTRCKCGGKVSRTGFQCANDHLILDIESSNLSDEKIEVFSQEVNKCRKCEYEGLPVEILECSKECTDPQRLDIFGVNMEVMTQGEKTESSIVMRDWDSEDLPKEYKGSVVPYDFEKTLLAPPAAVVASRFEVENPFGDSKNRTTPYNGKAVDSRTEPAGRERATRDEREPAAEVQYGESAGTEDDDLLKDEIAE